MRMILLCSLGMAALSTSLCSMAAEGQGDGGGGGTSVHAELLSGTVDDVKGRLGDQSADVLDDMRNAEQRGQNRTEVIEAIDAEKVKRVPPAGSTSGEQMFTQTQVDAMLAEKDQRHKAEIDKLKKAGTNAKPHTPKQAKPMTLDKTVDGPALTALQGATSIQFVDDEDRPIAGLSPMPFEAKDFLPAGGGVKLQKPVDFPTGLTATEISGAFLLNSKDEAVGKARLVSPFAIGAGRTTQLGPNALLFERPVKDDDEK